MVIVAFAAVLFAVFVFVGTSKPVPAPIFAGEWS